MARVGLGRRLRGGGESCLERVTLRLRGRLEQRALFALEAQIARVPLGGFGGVLARRR